ncbi:MAG TPA: carboxymuconolactone decarboxylase family protein [Thermoanaerobaculia bacterium]
MSRISRIGRSRVAGAVRDTFERKIAEDGNIPNMYRVFAHRPWLLTTMDAHFAAVMGSGTVPMQLKGLLAILTSRLNRSEHCLHSQTMLAAQTGVDERKIAALPEVEKGPFDEKELAALRYGLQVARDPNGVSDAVFADLARLFTEPEIVEITCVVGLFSYFNRFNAALRLAPTQAAEGADS